MQIAPSNELIEHNPLAMPNEAGDWRVAQLVFAEFD